MHGDQPKNFHILGQRVEKVPSVPSASILEAFPNRFQDRLYMVSMVFPEFTSLCPVTGQPDFGTIVLEYAPDKLCVESKSFKIYLFAFRSHQSFMETITNTILNDLVETLDPLWCRVKGLFKPRGATHIHVFVEHMKESMPDPLRKNVEQLVENWRHEPNPHECGL